MFLKFDIQLRGSNGIVLINAKGITIARQLFARDIKELRRVYPDIPNSKLQELIEMNKNLYLNDDDTDGELQDLFLEYVEQVVI